MAEQNQVSYEQLAQAYKETLNKYNYQLEVNQHLQQKIATEANQAAEKEVTINAMTTYAQQLENELQGYKDEKAKNEQAKQNRQQKRQAARSKKKGEPKAAESKS